MGVTINKGSLNGLSLSGSSGTKKSLTVNKPITFNIQNANNGNALQNNSWSNPWDTSNNLPGYRDVLGRLTEVYEQDQNQGMMYASQFETLMHDKTSPYYRVYSQPTNMAVSHLKEYGIDTAGLNDDFYAQNESWILDHLNYTGTGESPTKPGKKASKEQHIAYWMYQYYKDEGQTKKAEEEYQQALEEARYWGLRSDRNLSDDEIIAKVRENFSAKYPTLAQMEKKDAMAPFSLNRAVDFSDDAMIGAAWMGRNGEFDGTLEQAMAYSALGRGAQYERNDEISAKLDPNSDKFDGGYSLGATNLDDAAFHFRVSGFNKQWLDDHKDIPLNGTEEDKKMYAKVVEAYNNQTQGQEELDKLIEFVETKAQFCSSPEDVLKKINWSDYKILAAMDKSIGQNGNYATGNLVPLTEGLAYTYNGLTDYVNQLFEYKSQKRTCDMFIGQITSAIDNTIPALVQQTAEQEAEQQEEAAKIASHSTYRPTAEITETAKAIAAEKDRKTAESAEMTFGVDNDEEKIVNQNQRSAFYDQTVATLSDMKAGGYVDYTVRALAPTLKTSTIKQYSKSVLTGFDTVQAYEQNEKRIEELQATKDELGAKLGNMIHAGKEYGNEETVPVTINGKTYDLKLTWNNRDQYNEETGEMDIAGEYGVGGVFEHGTQDAAHGDFTNEQYQEAVQAALDEANAGRSAWEETRGTELTDEMRADIDAYWKASEELDAAKLTQQDNEEAYQTSKKNIEDAKALQNNRIALFKQAGLDTRAMEEAAVVTDFFLDFTKYDPTGWGSYNFYHPLSEMLTNGDATADEAFQVAETGDAEILQAMDVARTMLEYADENGIELPDSVRENVLRYIGSLETQHQDFEYMSMMRNEDFSEGTAEGRKRAEELSEIDYASFDAGLTNGQTYREVLESQPSWDILTEDQRIQLLTMADQMDSAKESALISGNPLPATYGMEEIQETYNAYLAELKIEDRAFGAFPFQVPMGEIMTDYELDTYYYLLGTQGFEAAQEYSDHIALDNGVLNSRLRERTEENAQNLADKGFWGRRAADALSMLLSPVAAAQSFAYSVNYGMRKLTGERVEWNPNSADLSANIYKKAAREEIQNQINETYKDHPVLQKFMSGLQEIISNRGDSIVNGLVFGPLFQGIGNEMLQEFASAMPMAVAAATDAVSEAKDKGASDTQLLGIYATTLLFEAGTEAVSLENIKGALKLGEDLTTDGLKEWAVNWLTKSGVSEMIGETITEAVEQAADTIFLGENSDYARAVEQYKADGMSEDEAKQQASLDQVKNLLHTALISYLSPGADIGSYAVGRYTGYRSEARAQQLAGNNVSVLDVYNNYKQQKQGERAEQNGTNAEIAEIEANNTAPDIEGPYVGEVETNRIATIEAQQAQQIAEAEEQKRAAEAKLRAEGLTLDIEILETAATGDPSVQTASIAAVLNTDRTDESFDVSNAAAVHMNALFAGEISPAQSVQNLMLGANVSDVSVTELKSALETAALSPNSEAYKVMQSEEYQNADPAERAEMLAATVETDANNATVQSDISKAVHDNRVARAENDVIDAPEVKGAYEKTYNAQGDLLAAQEATQQAQEQLDSYESELDAKRDALRTAGDEMANDASDATRVDMVNHAIADLQKTSEVVEEYRQHLTKAQQKQQEAEEIASRTLQEYQNTKRTLAERLVNEQDQQRSEAQAQAEAQAVIDEAKAQAQAEQEAAEAQAQEEADNAVLLDAEAFIEQQEAENGPLTEEEKQKVRDMFVARNAVKEEQGAGNTAQSAEQTAPQAEGQQTTPTVRPNLDKVRSRIANKFGMNIEFMDTMEDGKTLPNGQKFRKNGYYDKATNTIILDSKNATVNDMMYFVLGHELTHVAEQSGKYNDLANSIMRIFYGDNADYQGVLDQLNSGNINSQIARDVAAKKAIYDRKLGGVHSNEEILQEVIADRMGQILYGENEEQRADYINRLCKEDVGTARRIVESIKNFLKQVVGMKGAWVSDMQRTVDLFETALKDAQSAKAFKENSKAEAQPVDVAQQPVTGAENAMSGEEFQNTLKNTGLSIPEYKITDGWYGNQPTIKFESAPDQIVTEALENIGMVPGKDAMTFKAQKGANVPHAKITWALKNVPLPDAGGKTVAENTQNTNVRYSLPEEETEQNAIAEDTSYLEAVDNGDMGTAQTIVDEAAQQAGYTDKAYHGTTRFGFTEFDMERGNGAVFVSYNPELASSYTDDEQRKIHEDIDYIKYDSSDPEQLIDIIQNENIKYREDKNKGWWKIRDVSKNEDGTFQIKTMQGERTITGQELADAINETREIEQFGLGGVYQLYTRPGNQLVIDANGNDHNNIPVDWSDSLQTTNTIAQYAREHGYDSVRINNVYDPGGHAKQETDNYGDIGIFFNNESVKSADPVTYDGNGNVIPPSKRFQGNNPDIRYSLPSDDILDQQIAEFMNRRNTQAQPSNPRNSGMGVRQWGNEGAQQSDELDAKAKAYVLNSPYAKDTNAAELARALEWVRGNKQYANDDGFRTSLEKVTSKRFNYRSKDGQARMVAVMALAVAKGDINAQVELADAYNRQGTDLGQALQARKLFRLMTPEGRIASLRKMLGRVQEQTGNDDIRLSDWIYEAASQATDENEFLKIQKAAAAELAEQIPGNWKDKLRALRMLSMLGNPRTHIRNIVGNALFVPAVSLKNEIGALAEVITGQTERTKTLKLVLPKEIREFTKQDAEFMKDDLTGESKYNEGNMVQREQKPFNGFMQSLIDFNSNALESEDWFFLKGHYQRALGGWIDANGYTIDQLKNDTALLDKGRAYAIQEAQKATYRDFNGLADKLNQLSRNPQTSGQKALGFVTDAVLPFKKTPANILKRGIEYSPAGLVRGLKNAMLDVKSGKITATEAIDRICSGLAGTAVMVMGAFLAHSGIVTCSLGDDDDKNDKEQGNQKYSIKLNLFGEDVTYTMDWAAPMSMPFFVGAAIENQMRKEGDFDINELVNAMSNIAEPVFNLSMLDGVNTLFKTSQNSDTDAITQIGAKVLSNYATSYVPSLLGAVARTVDDKRRSTFVESGQGKGVTGTIRYALEQAENKIPGLSQTNIAQKDVFGREETDSLAERFFENFISPGYISHYKNDPILNEMDRLYNANVTDSEDMVPSDPPKSFKYGEKQYTLSAEEWDTFKTVRGQTALGMLTELINSSEYKDADDAAQVQMIKNVWDYATKVGKNAVVPEYLVEGNTTVAEIAKDGKITSCYDNMLTSLKNGDYMGYETMVEALHQMDVKDSKIKEKIANKYRKSYQQAYISGDQYKMAEIEQILDMTDFTFDLNKWEEDAEKNYGKQ